MTLGVMGGSCRVRWEYDGIGRRRVVEGGTRMCSAMDGDLCLCHCSIIIRYVIMLAPLRVELTCLQEGRLGRELELLVGSKLMTQGDLIYFRMP
jgi:hypothetical protein